MNKAKILLVEDNIELAESIIEGLIDNKYAPTHSPRGDSALGLIISESYDLIIMDVMLPGIDGLKVVEKIRQINIQTPVLILTAMGTNTDTLKGFNAGADDYISKPFDFDILLARINSLLKRSSNITEGKFGDLKIDLNYHTVSRGEVSIKLTPREFSLFSYLLMNEGKALTRDHLMKKAWKSNSSDTNQIDVYIKYLRNKIEKPLGSKYIKTVRGIGYYFTFE